LDDLNKLSTVAKVIFIYKISRSTRGHERLKSHGDMGESFDDLINRILDDWEEGQTNE
jgi:hypothetical protein